jgi:serine/threonine-protein kinase
MSPEHMFEPATTDARSDLFSLGAVAYFALTGHAPFETDTLEALYLAIDAGAFVPASQRRRGLPRALDAWFERALANRPEERFPDARAMAAALYDALRGAEEERLAEARREASAVRASWIPTLGEIPGLPRRRFHRLRKAPIAVLALAASTAFLVLWDGFEMPAAVAASASPDPPPAATVSDEDEPGVNEGVNENRHCQEPDPGP